MGQEPAPSKAPQTSFSFAAFRLWFLSVSLVARLNIVFSIVCGVLLTGVIALAADVMRDDKPVSRGRPSAQSPCIMRLLLKNTVAA